MNGSRAGSSRRLTSNSLNRQRKVGTPPHLPPRCPCMWSSAPPPPPPCYPDWAHNSKAQYCFLCTGSPCLSLFSLFFHLHAQEDAPLSSPHPTLGTTPVLACHPPHWSSPPPLAFTFPPTRAGERVLRPPACSAPAGQRRARLPGRRAGGQKQRASRAGRQHGRQRRGPRAARAEQLAGRVWGGRGCERRA